MKRAHCVNVGACSWLAGHTGALIIGLAVVWMAAAPSPMWCQWSGTNPVWTYSNVGIGTTSAAYPLQVRVWADQNFYVYSNGTNTQIGAVNNASTAYTPITVQASMLLLQPYGGSVGIGTTNPGSYKLAVEGTIGARDVIVTNTPWSDYVFRPGYRLRPLSEVGAYIRANHHLPDIPSEAEVKEKGVSVGEMQAKLLAKVEELTLHMIQQDEENRELRDRLARLEKGAASVPTTAAK